jgi:hypothetical protein
MKPDEYGPLPSSPPASPVNSGNASDPRLQSSRARREYAQRRQAHRQRILKERQERENAGQRLAGIEGRPWSIPLCPCDCVLQWVNRDYAAHLAVCPVCGFEAELRVYFEGDPGCTLERPISACRIKCAGLPYGAADEDMPMCTVGTGDVSGLYLYPPEWCRDPHWTRDDAREYLRVIGSPLAGHPTFA